MSLCSCGGCGCSQCSPANSIFSGECADPGTLAIGRFISVLDHKFCERRLTNAPGFLTATVNGSGNYNIGFTTEPQVALSEVQAVANAAFGNIIVLGADNRWRYLSGPVAAGLYMQTNANGDVVFGSAPAATVPDPLAINDLNVANLAALNDVTTGGTVTLNNIAAGTVVNLLALNAANELIIQAVSAGVAASMFFESATSPNAATPNSGKTDGQYLIIGNRLFDSGGNLISVTTSESITVNVTGKYLLMWAAQSRTGGASRVGAWLEINGVIVNQGNGRTTGVSNAGAASVPVMFPMTGFELRTLTANDVIRLQLSAVAGSIATYEVRLIAVKFAD